MMSKKVLGIIYSNSYDSSLGSLTARRTMGSVPFGGRYRLIDFILSNLVNSGVSKVGVIANSNFRSLMDHVGSGRPWDLSRKMDGLFMLPPFTAQSTERDFNNRIEVLNRIMDFISGSKEEYVLISDANVVCNMDFQELFDFHSEKNADITIVYCNGKIPKLEDRMVLTVDSNDKISEISISPKTDEDVFYSTNIILVNKAILERLIGDAESFGYANFEKDIIQKNVNHLNIYGYCFEGESFTIDSLNTFFAANMSLLSRDCRKDLFNKDRPIFTKVKNEMPVVYGIGSETKNSLISDGCLIEGTVINSVLSRGVRVAKGAVVENSIIMQDAFVGEDVKLNCVIMDKKAVVTPKKSLSGDESYPLYVGKDIII